jgi:uncharacterized membrane protein YhhN
MNLLYWIAGIGCLIGRLLQEPYATNLDYIFKPMLMPFLALILYTEVGKRWNRNHSHLLIALVFAFGGDMALMLGDGIFFLLGLGSFLLMQLLYIFLFKKDWPRPSLLVRKSYLALPFAAMGISFYFLALPALIKDSVMVFAVAVYAAALVGMTLSALNRKGSVPEKAFMMTFIGALLFLASDFMIGFNQFIIKDFPYAGFAIMITYISGQWLIVKGYISAESKNK